MSEAFDQRVIKLARKGGVPSYPKFTADRAGWIKFGANNLFPQELVEDNSRSAVNGAIIESKVTYICGNGIIEAGDHDTKETIIGAPSPDETWDEFFEKLATDYVTFGGFCFQVIKNRNGNTLSLFHQDFSAVRLGKLDPDTNEPTTYRIANDWRKTTGKNKPVKLSAWKGSIESSEDADEDDIEEGAYLYYFADYRPDLKYYPVPSYYNALEYIRADGELGEFYNNSISNGFTPSVVISMPSNPHEEKKEKFQKDMERAFTGAKGASSIVTLWGDSDNVKPTITPFNASANADIYNNVEAIVFQKIISAHRLASPTLAGVSGSGNLSGNAAEIIDAFVLFNHTVINKMRKKLLNHINKFTAINKTATLDIEELDVVDRIRETKSGNADTYTFTKK